MEAITHCQLRHLALCCSSSTSATSSFSPSTSRWRPHSKGAHSTSRRSSCLKSRVTRMALEQKSPSPAVKCLSAPFSVKLPSKLLPILLAVGTPKPSFFLSHISFTMAQKTSIEPWCLVLKFIGYFSSFSQVDAMQSKELIPYTHGPLDDVFLKIFRGKMAQVRKIWLKIYLT